MIAGASAVQVGTYSFVQPTGMLEIISYARRYDLSLIKEIIGSAIVDKNIDLKKAEQKI